MQATWFGAGPLIRYVEKVGTHVENPKTHVETMGRIAVLILTLALALVPSGASAREAPYPSLGQISPDGLSPDQAEQLLVFALKHEKYRLDEPGVFIEHLVRNDGTPYAPGYVGFLVQNGALKAGAIEVWGMFDVSQGTGDIWDSYACKRITFPTLQRLQKTIMTHTGKTMADERDPSTHLVGCVDEDE